jgi:hypothetical protein
MNARCVALIYMYLAPNEFQAAEPLSGMNMDAAEFLAKMGIWPASALRP